MSHRVIHALRGLFVVVFVLSIVTTASFAQTWSEVGDAGDLPGTAQATVGVGALTTITGSLWADTDVDVYCIRITDEAAFKARLQCVAWSGPSPFLFDASGVGVATTDECSGGDKLISSTFVTTNGVYYLAIAPMPITAVAGADDIWVPVLSTERAPDGPGAANPVTSWGGAPVVQPINPYTVYLTGAEFCDAPVPTESRSWGRVKTIYH